MVTQALKPTEVINSDHYEPKTQEIARKILAASKGGFWDKLKGEMRLEG